MTTKPDDRIDKQGFIEEKNSVFRNLKNRILDENNSNKMNRITKILNQLDFNCWFYCNEPIYQVCRKEIHEYIRNNHTLSEEKYKKIWKCYSFNRVYKTIMELKEYCVHRTLNNCPFLELNKFYWKENIFYSKKISIYLIIHQEKEGPLYCNRCKLNMTKYNYLREYCSLCKHSLENKYYNSKNVSIQSRFKTYDFTEEKKYVNTSACPNGSIISNSYFDFLNHYYTTRKNK